MSKDTSCKQRIKINEIVNGFLLVRNKFMQKMHLLIVPVLLIVLAVHSQETKKELKSLCKLEIQTLFIKMNLIKLVFNMIWLMKNQKI